MTAVEKRVDVLYRQGFRAGHSDDKIVPINRVVFVMRRIGGEYLIVSRQNAPLCLEEEQPIQVAILVDCEIIENPTIEIVSVCPKNASDGFLRWGMGGGLFEDSGG
jgi:hypothetical protein